MRLRVIEFMLFKRCCVGKDGRQDKAVEKLREASSERFANLSEK